MEETEKKKERRTPELTGILGVSLGVFGRKEQKVKRRQKRDWFL